MPKRRYASSENGKEDLNFFHQHPDRVLFNEADALRLQVPGVTSYRLSVGTHNSANTHKSRLCI